MKYISRSIQDTYQIAQEFLNTISQIPKHSVSGATIVALQGDLGSGKTAFTQKVGKILGIEENMHSPTFVIMKIYKLTTPSISLGAGNNQQPTANFKNLIHIDSYRLEREEELLHLGWEEIIKEPENLIFIEWPENVAKIIPESAKKISFKFIDDVTREISYEKEK